MRILVFDKFLGYNVGGAQSSLHFFLERWQEKPDLLGCEVKKSFGAERNKVKNLQVWRFAIKEFPRFPYFEHWYNRKRTYYEIANRRADLLITQGLWGAIAVKAFKGKKVYFIRDEYQLNRIPLYQKGVKKILKIFYLAAQLPFIMILFRDNRKAIRQADVIIANSRYIRDELIKKFKRESEIVYPFIDIEKLKMSARGVAQPQSAIYITCVGSEYMKGRLIMERIAKRMRGLQFMIVGREFNESVKKGNIVYEPWSADVTEVYNKTKLLIVPSICAEAFCRVAVEGMAFGIPVIGSMRGGIPEVLPTECLVDDIWNIDQWVVLIKKFIDKRGVGNTALNKFNVSDQVDKLKMIISKLLYE